ncbi:MAG: hypothetical protein M5U01_05500 [Ardenticatenaceae bacterium]|nr:hypothetical protein [Ardenticatenaceae bacterium]HBY97815.1 hypothetical protein [Chloroflexota bacterium]
MFRVPVIAIFRAGSLELVAQFEGGLRVVRLYDEATGVELGTIREEDLAFLQANLEEEGLDDHDYWINPTTIEMLETRGASPQLIALLRAAVGTNEAGVDVEFEREGETRQRLRRR